MAETSRSLRTRPGRGGRRAVGVLAVALAAAAGAWWLRPAPVDPPMPLDIKDAEVRHAIEQARQKVLAKPRSDAA
jgi:hypothetical protein